MAEELVQNEQEEIVDTVEETKTKKGSSSKLDLGGLEFYYEKNKKIINYAALAIVAVVGVFSFYKFYWLPGQESEAANEAFYAQNYFEKDSFNIALNGGVNVQTGNGPKTMMGFKDIADNYGSTKTGNLANFYAGICLLRTGKFEEAIEYLQKFDSNDEMMGPTAVGAIGDANMELNRVDEALKFYLKAADKSINSFTTPLYLKKAGFAYEQKASYADAISTYERIKNEYPRSTEGRDIEKYIARAKTLGNIQ